MIHFHSPYAFLLLLLIPLFFMADWITKRSTLRFSSLSEIKLCQNKSTALIKPFLFILRMLAYILLVTALARPQTTESEREYETKGIDIVLALDISGSMLAEDFKPNNRVTVAKMEAKKFVQGRENDRIGLVVFSRKSYTQCPLTLDYHVLADLIENVNVGLIKDGTAIGLGLANSVNRLRESDVKSKVIILLTDGENNAGNIDPITAAELAKSYGIKVYTIGIGKSGLVPFPIEDPVFGKRYIQTQVNVDDKTLKRIADITGGQYFAATDANVLHQIYRQIDKLEKSKVKIKEYTSFSEQYKIFLIPAIFILICEIIFRNLFFIKIP
ncbi:MAG: aerotolerance regulator BatA [Omnitrophica bacterium RIFCSPLOWO2_12_FULL_44_17]|uniref:Aerotolerance regulator BatA n=1 Tax=Candidatus Danuiimicrobium aquiferis TaxID=1801832 RepID=A0A1G1KYP5_9BACT|nr:MAG: aerotolerance regulator BatA [Omnitrophica bacterium RIFCSPHIGHO2_02_FULL_45_28]OGW90379.1 MAG: aerotolerance regulator BatA [Omnitrophica bacterium RIFCSPHIGHO2_12_FULL_44_12]OGW98001.1 MAG: aerotolerance regulator BatA [Omnitrophica bacterium RIFCSPLOWO2_12_FULL_44_17]OGX03555.1 MAG: aerotolerance regulator BatA [Omnitrophica bacterium RIFCSPLOWO2_02_FULL_44_11]